MVKKIFYTTKLDGEIHKLCNWGGWFIKHPYLKDYYPRKVLKGEKNKYCNIKALITRDQKFAELYIENNEFEEHYKFDIYHLFQLIIFYFLTKEKLNFED